MGEIVQVRNCEQNRSLKKILVILFSCIFLNGLYAQQIIDTTRIFGVTIDDPWTQTSDIADAFSNHKIKPTARIVFDEWISAEEYREPINELKPYCFLMGEIFGSRQKKNRFATN